MNSTARSPRACVCSTYFFVQPPFAASHYWVEVLLRCDAAYCLRSERLYFAWNGCTESDAGGADSGGFRRTPAAAILEAEAAAPMAPPEPAAAAGAPAAAPAQRTSRRFRRQMFGPRCALSAAIPGTVPAATLEPEHRRMSEASLLGVPAALCDGRTRVVAGDSAGSLLYAKLAGQQPAECGERMPVAGMLAVDAMACVEASIAGLDPERDPVMPDPSCETCGTGACVDTASDASHCGRCGLTCPAGASCDQGTCRCPAPQILCEGQCSATCSCDGEISERRVCRHANRSAALRRLCHDLRRRHALRIGQLHLRADRHIVSMDVAPILANNCTQAAATATGHPRKACR